MTEVKHEHPFRKARLCVYQQVEGDGPEWIAFFEPQHKYPIVFRCESQQTVTKKAETFRQEAIDKHEHNYSVKQEALVKARAAKKKRKALKDD